MSDVTPPHSVHTTNFPQILNQLGLSLIVSTYQAGKLIVLRSDGDVINTHFRVFNKPMGVAANTHRMAIGSAYQIWELRNVPAVGGKLDPPGKHDACYLPRQTHITGDIDIHEMAYASDGLWFVNTRFSCLCTLDPEHSFKPRWRPPFVSAYDLSDRCHLNGLCLVDDKPKYVTALGETDTAAGWRPHKASGGILMDVTTNDFICRGLSMPHSPRWYRGQLWVLESGQGSLAKVDLATGELTPVVELPGFTRGIDFWGSLAFVGLSQVRETAIFSGIPITERLTDRICGIWVVNIDTGEIVAFLRFEAGVQEIFAVQVLPGIRFPEVIDWDETLLGSSFVLPDEALAQLVITEPPPEVVNTPDNLLALGNTAYREGKLVDAAQHYRSCLELDANFIQARYNLGIVCTDLERWDEAIQSLERVLALDPNHADAYNQLAVVHNHLNYLLEAITYGRKAVALRSDYALGHFNLGLALLASGDLVEGFSEYEWRWQLPTFTPLQCPYPEWDGSDISHTSILVHTEQGAGDAIQFIRYIPLLAQQCRQVLLCCPDNLVELFRPVPGIARIYTAGEIPLSDFQTYIPLMSLPRLFKTTLRTIPQTVPYLFPPVAPARKPWSDPSSHSPAPKGFQTPKPSQALKVGIVWGGSPTHANDRHRSSRLQQWIPVLRTKGVNFVSLQKGARRVQDLQDLPSRLKLENWDPYLNSFADTAGAIATLDLVITVDTSVAHLAGAMAKPVWVLLCYAPDWRWMLERHDSPWYPTMRLFRQTDPDDWETVFERVHVALQTEVESRRMKPRSI